MYIEGLFIGLYNMKTILAYEFFYFSEGFFCLFVLFFVCLFLFFCFFENLLILNALYQIYSKHNL